MYKYHCTNCSYVYNPYIGNSEQDIEYGTDFADIYEDWSCPVCGEGKDFFIEVKENIIEVTNLMDLLPEEERHIPFYEEKDGKIIISVGSENEPFVQDDNHFIEYIGIYDEYGEEIQIFNLPDIENEIITDIPDDNYEVRASCSLHGVWKGIKTDGKI